jgi:VCBS repeat-containing protein
MTTATGTNGNDLLSGSTGSDTLSGGNGSDSLSGGFGNDVLSGGNGGDTLSGGGGNDVLIGGNDGDTLNGGEGADTIIGGNGDDMLYLDEFDKVVDGQNGFDTLLFTQSGQTLDLTSNTGIAGIEAIQMLDGGYNSLTLSAADILRISDNDTLVINGDETSSVTFTDGGWQLTSLADDGSSVFSNGTTQIRLAAATAVKGVSGNATIGAPTNTDVTEDSGATDTLSVSGTIPVSDPEAWSALLKFQVQPAADALGILMLAPDGEYRGTSSGQYTYYVDNTAVQFLGEGVVHTDRFTVTAMDGTTAVVSFNITGVNDAAQVSGATSASVTEDTNVNADKLEASFSLSVTDVDAGEAAFDYSISDVVQGTDNLGTLTYAGNGVFNYSVNNSAVQSLNEGAVRTERFDIVTLDGTIQTVQVNIQGKDDPFTVALPSYVPSMIEDSTDPSSPGNLTASFKLDINDPDAIPGSLINTQTQIMLNGEWVGHVLVESDGTASAVIANSAVQYLGEGDKLSVGSDVYDADAQLVGYVSFDIIGKNDAAVIDISGLNTLLHEDDVTAAGVVMSFGWISITDIDDGEAAFEPVSLLTAVPGGSGTLTADGYLTYMLQNYRTQYLREGQTLVDHMTVTAVDGTTKVIDFTIIGKNDLPTLVVGTTQGSVTEYEAGPNMPTAPHGVTGSFQVSDVDVGDTLSFQITALGSGYVGSLSAASIVSTGGLQQASWSFSVDDSAIDYLAQGQQLTQSYQVKLVDQYGQASQTMQVDIHITGAWDGAGYIGPYTGPSTPSTSEGDHLTGSGSSSTQYHSGSGDDWLEAGIYSDELYGGAGNDALYGFGGADLLFGESGDDLLYGGDGADALDGGDGTNLMYGGAGNDQFTSAFSTNTQMFGEDGDDTFDLSFADNAKVTTGSGADTLYINFIGGLIGSAQILDFNSAEDKIFIWSSMNGSNPSAKLVTVDAAAHIYRLVVSDSEVRPEDGAAITVVDQQVMTFVGVPLTEAEVLQTITFDNFYIF